MLFTVNQTQDRPRAGRMNTGLRAAPAPSSVPVATATATATATAGADVLRIISDPRTPTFVTVYANGRRRYSYWRPLDSTTGQGGCYAALPTGDCDALHEAGKIELGNPVVDANRTTYRVSASSARVTPPARALAAPLRPVRERTRPVRAARVA
ncbi:hypothetical protein ACFYQA_39110 [Streptomyces sp. NPDC005774]|uniref:hypothetical protein n=1 Tax=Streptomyces sp. NPDC005774 TaxID=3364728 RepID=UPI0036AB220C